MDIGSQQALNRIFADIYKKIEDLTQRMYRLELTMGKVVRVLPLDDTEAGKDDRA